jgi:GNAT superfamily N-acetyltransferase
MDLEHVKKTKSVEYFDQIERIYIDSFPASQVRSEKKIRQMLETDPQYHLFIAKHRDLPVGFSLLYVFNELRVALLDFMAIDKGYRGRNVGSDLFKYTFATYQRLIKNPIGIILEVQRETSGDLDTISNRNKRIVFYKRLGAKIFEDVHYLLPNLHEGEPEDMYLMLVPNHDIKFVDKTFVFRIIKMIYKTFYDIYETNNLKQLMAGLPTRIRLI